ncbi:hypothetical protein CEXT_431451 [Caerostris extrusa]|uniref:Uncharacterized protein n=1 Tax=Caerostris extrusa TaxID=172846 RepID=A0AAV4TMX5_CAEEX|nr:hypothetical protein CEXT_431451 [Caerostris extrusa]
MRWCSLLKKSSDSVLSANFREEKYVTFTLLTRQKEKCESQRKTNRAFGCFSSKETIAQRINKSPSPALPFNGES